jgi:hypothetical protein
MVSTSADDRKATQVYGFTPTPRTPIVGCQPTRHGNARGAGVVSSSMRLRLRRPAVALALALAASTATGSTAVAGPRVV